MVYLPTFFDDCKCKQITSPTDPMRFLYMLRMYGIMTKPSFPLVKMWPFFI